MSEDEGVDTPRSDADALLARYRSGGDPKDLAALFDAKALLMMAARLGSIANHRVDQAFASVHLEYGSRPLTLCGRPSARPSGARTCSRPAGSLRSPA